MSSPISNNLAGLTRSLSTERSAGESSSANASGTGFSETFEKYLDEVTSLQREASQSVQQLVTGQTDDLAGVMSAMEKSDVAFKTLLAIRSKLLDAYNELRNMPI